MRFLSTAVLTASLALLASPLAAEQLPDGLYADFITPHGVITAELHYTQAPLTCANFTGLAEGTLAPKNGQPFYTGLTFYRVVPGFVPARIILRMSLSPVCGTMQRAFSRWPTPVRTPTVANFFSP